MEEVPERVELERSGGFANIPVRASLPGSALAPDELAGIPVILAREAAAGAVPGAPDRQQYDLRVVVGETTHHVRLGEQEVDARLRPLIRRLVRDAAP